MNKKIELVMVDNFMNKFGGAEKLWERIKQYAAKGGREATRMMLELYYVLKSPDTSMGNKALIAAALSYQLLPTDLLSTKTFGVLGLLDNAAALVFVYKKVKSLVTPEIRWQVNGVLEQWFGPEVEMVEP